MNIDMNTVWLVGAAQLLVFATAILSDRLLASVVESGSISDILVNVSKNVTRMRTSNLVALVETLATIVLGVLFYIVFHEQYKILALVALGFFLAEAISMAVSKIGAFALIPLSQEFVEAGAPKPSYFQTLGDFLYYGVDKQGSHIHNLFFCMGGIIWYSLFLSSGYIPEALAIWGLAGVSLLLIPVLLLIYDRDFAHPVMVVGLVYLPFELVFGVWLIVMGFNLR